MPRALGRAAGGYGPREQADDLVGLITALGLRRPAILGHSMGAGTALALAGAYPDVPGAILLEDPPAWWTDWYNTPHGVERRAQMRDGFMALKRKTRDELLADKRAEEPGWSDDELRCWADAKQRFSPDVLKVLNRDNPLGVDWQAILPRISCPALLITADPDLGAIVTEGSAASLRALVPKLDVAHVPGAGHSIRRDQFERYMAVVRQFLAAHASEATH